MDTTSPSQSSSSARTSPRRMKNNQCLPRMRATAAVKTHRGLSPISLLERFREAVFRLMMISALSKPAAGGPSAKHGRRTSPSPDHHQTAVRRATYHHHHLADHSEAVADCIEFIKKTSLTQHDAGAGGSNTTSTVMPVPVM